jgi:ubiquinone/menaquinone biosynthesis C-methylase UbiE
MPGNGSRKDDISSRSSDLPDAAKRFTGFAEIYDRYRPSPPEVLRSILPQLAQVSVLQLVTDLGCGTGLSTCFWEGQAAQIIGIDPSMDMLQQARTRRNLAGIAYLLGFADCTGIAGGRGDLVTCAHSLHWMEPGPALAEVARLLRGGGVFAAYDHDFYPVLLDWEADVAHHPFRKQAIELDKRYGNTGQAAKWPKSEHLSRMQESGYFRYTREFTVHLR